MTWLTRILWLSLPVTLGDLLTDAFDDASSGLAWTAAVLGYGLWTAGLLASLVVQPWALLLLRIVAPLAAIAGAVAAVDVEPSPLGWAGIAAAVVAAAAAMSADVGYEFVNGASYGDEARFPLRPPAVLLLGPIAVVWALTALPLPVGLLALGDQQWVPGAALVLIGAPAAWWGVRVLSRLTRRWCVFVPAGITLVDDMALAEPTLLRSSDIVQLGPAPVDTTALDLSAGASGLILQVDLQRSIDVVPAAPRGGVTEAVQRASVLFAPSRPGALLRHAGERGIGAASSRT